MTIHGIDITVRASRYSAGPVVCFNRFTQYALDDVRENVEAGAGLLLDLGAGWSVSADELRDILRAIDAGEV